MADNVIENSVSHPAFWNDNLHGTRRKAFKHIKSIQLKVLDQATIRRTSVCPVTTTTLYEKSLPRAFGINDVRMGPVDRKLRCGTCHNGIKDCNGHIGHIELASPVYHVAYISYILKVLRCLCPRCHRLCVPLTDKKLLCIRRRHATRPKERFNAITEYLKSKRQCQHKDCGIWLPKHSLSGLTLKREWLLVAREQMLEGQPPKKKRRKKNDDGAAVAAPLTVEEKAELQSPLTPTLVQEMFEMADDEVVDVLGLSDSGMHPRNFILSTLVVPPPIIRPSISFSESSRTRGQDDLTHKLQEILKTSMRVQATTEPAARAPLLEQLQLLCATYVDNDCSGAKVPTKRRSGLPEKCITQRLKGKKGRVRGNLMGKRVDFSGRTVISPDCMMDVDEIGVPYEIALRLTFTETVNGINIHKLSAMVKRGANVLGGARSVTKLDGTNVQLEYHKSPGTIRLQIGWKVERYMQDGDVVLFNRQPSLRKKSIMAHRVRLMPFRTFRLNLSCTGPYNGDFDGDEMNIHLLQDWSAIAEARELMSVEKQVLNAQNNKPCIGIVQDSLVGSFLLTGMDQFLDKAEMMQLLMSLRYPLANGLPPPAICKPQELWTGKQAFSLLIPDISIGSGKGCMGGGEDVVVIRRGELLVGRMTKKMLGSSSGGIIHVCCLVLSNKVALRFMSDCQRLVNLWMEGVGFSIGLSDCLISPETAGQVHTAIRDCVGHVDMVNAMGKSLGIPLPKREAHASGMLSKMLDVTGGMVSKSLAPDTNALTAMVMAGSKGNPINVSQIMGCVGQQSIEGHRIYDLSNPTDRTISCFRPGDDSAVSRGFVQNSYVAGLNADEMFFHTMGGREGIVDTSVKTADTGYLQRRIMKALESYAVQYDGTVRDTSKNVLEFVYGGDSCDAQFLEKVELWFLKLPFGQVRSQFFGESEEEFTRYHDLALAALQCKLTLNVGQLSLTSYLPVNVPMRLRQVCQDPPPGTALTAAFAEQAVAALLLHLEAAHPHVQTLFLRVSIAFFLSSRLVIELGRFTQESFTEFLDHLLDCYRRTSVDAGEFVGILAAESVGEPCTQLTLNTFHAAGIAEKNVTLGVPRIKELIDARRNIRSPSTTVHLHHTVSGNKAMAKVMRERLVQTKLADVVRATSVHTGSDSLTEPEDLFMLRALAFFPLPHDVSACVIRVELDRDVLMRKELTVENVRDVVRAYVGEVGCHVQASEVNMPKWVLHLRMRGLQDMRQRLAEKVPPREVAKVQSDFDRQIAQMFLDHLSTNVRLCGVEGVVHAAHDEETVTRVVGGELQTRNEFTILTSGVNLREIWNQPMVDWQRTASNEVFETLEILGVEAAAMLLFYEIRKVLSFDGGYIDNRHIMMVTNCMLSSGTIMGLNRHGLNKLATGPLVKSTFEQTVDIFFDSAAFGEHNPLDSISDNIMCGQRIPGGTGLVSLVMDPEYLKQATASKRPDTAQKKQKHGSRVIRTYYSHFLAQDETQIQSHPPAHEPESPIWMPGPSPTSPMYNPTSPTYNPTSPSYWPKDDEYDPASPSYFPSAHRTPPPATRNFLERNHEGNHADTYTPSTPSIPLPALRYRPSTPRL